MFKRMTNGRIAILLIILLGLFLADRMWNSNDAESNYETELVNIDTSAVTKMILYAKADSHNPITFTKSDGWRMEIQGKEVPADDRSVKGILDQLNSIESTGLAARSRDQWAVFELTDSLADRIEVYEGEEKVLDLMIGKFAFKQQQQSGISYVRKNAAEEIHMTEGFLSMIFKRGGKYFRNSKIIRSNPDDFNAIRLTTPNGGGYSLNREQSHWIADFEADSAAVAVYVQELSEITSFEFSRDQAPSGTPADFQLEVIDLQGNSIADITIYRLDSQKSLIHSSQNPGVYFEADSTLVDRVIRSREQLASKEAL